MSQLELLQLVLSNLEKLGMESMLVGSYASSYYGESRTTHDVDLVVDFDADQIEPFVALFDPERYYVSPVALREGRRSNVIDTRSGDKVDLFLLQDDEDSRRQFQRRTQQTLFDIDVSIVSPEDVVLSKLRWDAQLGGSQQQRNDILNVLQFSMNRLDMQYIFSHAGELRGVLNEILDQLDDG